MIRNVSIKGQPIEEFTAEKHIEAMMKPTPIEEMVLKAVKQKSRQ